MLNSGFNLKNKSNQNRIGDNKAFGNINNTDAEVMQRKLSETWKTRGETCQNPKELYIFMRMQGEENNSGRSETQMLKSWHVNSEDFAPVISTLINDRIFHHKIKFRIKKVVMNVENYFY